MLLAGPTERETRRVIEAAVRAAAVPPFHAMAMSREAARLEASGRRVLHLEVGQPSTPLPALAREAVRAHLDEQLGYTNAAGIHALRRRLAEREGVDIDRILVVAGASAGFTLAFLTLFETGRSRRRARAGLPVLPQHAAGAGHRTGRHPRRTGQPVGADPRSSRRRRRTRRAGARLTVQPDRNGAQRRGARRHHRSVPSPWDRGDRRRDLSRHRRRSAGRQGARPSPRGVRGQQLLEVLVDDRLASRLGGGAGFVDRHRRAAAAEPLHLRTSRLAGRCAGRARRNRRTRRGTSPGTATIGRSSSTDWRPRASPTSPPPTVRSTCTHTYRTSRPQWASTRCS